MQRLTQIFHQKNQIIDICTAQLEQQAKKITDLTNLLALKDRDKGRSLRLAPCITQLMFCDQKIKNLEARAGNNKTLSHHSGH